MKSWKIFEEEEQQLDMFVKHVMVAGIDYGSVIGDRPSLLKPGAEKLAKFFSLSIKTDITNQELDWTGENHKGEPFFYVEARCSVSDEHGRFIVDGHGSSNSWEPRHRYRWVDVLPEGVPEHLVVTRKRQGEIFEWQYLKRTPESQQYGRPESFYEHIDKLLEQGAIKQEMKVQPWNKQEALCYIFETVQYRVPNPDVSDIVNTLAKMAQKRAYVAAVLNATATSGRFTQDLEDMASVAAGGVQEWLPSFAEFYKTVELGLPLLMAQAKDDEERINLVRTLVKDKFNTGDTWDPTIASAAHQYLLKLNNQRDGVVREEEELMSPREGYDWLVTIAERLDATLIPAVDADPKSDEDYRHLFAELETTLHENGYEFDPPKLLPDTVG